MAGTNRLKKNIKGGPAIILVAPQLPENIGMAARAMANFGLIDLRIVRPKQSFPCEKSISASSKAFYIIEQAKLYNKLEEALEDLSFIYATSARKRYSYKKITAPETAMKNSYSYFNADRKVGIMFGRERVGLLNAELSLADEIITFPVNPAFASLNLAQAVLLIGYEWMCANLNDRAEPIFKELPMQPAKKKSLFSFFEHLERTLAQRGYFRPLEKKEIMINNLRAILTRPSFSEQELRVMHGVVAALEKFKPQN